MKTFRLVRKQSHKPSFLDTRETVKSICEEASRVEKLARETREALALRRTANAN